MQLTTALAPQVLELPRKQSFEMKGQIECEFACASPHALDFTTIELRILEFVFQGQAHVARNGELYLKPVKVTSKPIPIWDGGKPMSITGRISAPAIIQRRPQFIEFCLTNPPVREVLNACGWMMGDGPNGYIVDTKNNVVYVTVGGVEWLIDGLGTMRKTA